MAMSPQAMSNTTMGLSIATSVLSAIGAGIQAKQQAQLQKFQYEQAKLKAEYSAQVNELNAKAAYSDMIYNQIVMEQQAASNGLAAAQQMANTRVQIAASGVYMNSASKYEVQASEKFVQAVNHATMEQNRVNMQQQGLNKVQSFLGQAVLDRGLASANDTLGGAINPGQSFVAAAFGALGNNSFLQQYAVSQAMSGMTKVNNADLGVDQPTKSNNFGIDVTPNGLGNMNFGGLGFGSGMTI